MNIWGHLTYFHAGDLNFHSSSYDWLVVNQGGTNAQFKGSGTINGEVDYKFMLWAGVMNRTPSGSESGQKKLTLRSWSMTTVPIKP